MFETYKFVHIVAVIVWIGSVITVNILNARVARENDRAVMGAMARQSRFLGASIVGPAALVTLIAGILMLVDSDIDVELWIIWGLVAIFLSMALGATVIRRAGQELSESARATSPDVARITSLQRRLAILNIFNVILLLSAVWAMVAKPTL